MAPPPDEPLALGHLVRRATFGWGPGVDDVAGLPYEAAVARLMAGLSVPAPAPPTDFDPYRPGVIQHAWLARLLGGTAPLAERLTFFWHGHFATSQSKVVDGLLLWRQMETLRSKGAGRFEDLVLAMSRDVAMVRWLDGNANRKGHPNENYARELMELFALGRGAYDEQDVREVARAFSGWGSRHHDFAFTSAFHDEGEKSFLGRRGRFGGEDAVRSVVEHPACAPYVCAKLARCFATPEPSAAFVARLVAAWQASDGSIARVLEVLLLDPEMRAPEQRLTLVRSPIELAVVGARLTGRSELPAAVEGSLDRLGQVLFRPPSVKGWPSGTAWLTAGTLVERLRMATALAEGVAPDLATRAIARAYDAVVPAALATVLARAAPERRLALALAAPEFQLA